MFIEDPVEIFPGRSTNCANLRLHLMHFHVEDTIDVLNKGYGPNLRYNQR